MNIMEIILPIAIGALIGYCTNYIAIKMLFRPGKEIRVCGHRLPFTPGVIPKNQARLAKTTGLAVGNNLLTKEDIADTLKSGQLKEAVSGAVSGAVTGTDLTVGGCLDKLAAMGKGAEPERDFDAEEAEERGEILTEKIAVTVTEKIKHGLAKVDFTTLITDVAGSVIAEKVKGTMMAMFVNEGTIAFLAEPVGEVIDDYIEQNGGEMIYPIVRNEIEDMKEANVSELLEKGGIDGEFLQKAVGRFYDRMIDEHVDSLLEHFDVAGLVEEKINAMDVRELEDLVMSVMKNELQAVINLGALIGALIGILNIFLIR